MRKLWLTCACCAAGLAFSYSPPPASSWLPALGISHAAAQVFPGHYRRVARRVYRRIMGARATAPMPPAPPQAITAIRMATATAVMALAVTALAVTAATPIRTARATTERAY